MITINYIIYGNYRKLSQSEMDIYDGYKNVITDDYTFNVTIDKEIYDIVVPIGFLTDGATFAPDLGIGWLLHDYLYATHLISLEVICTKDIADQLLKCVLYYENFFFSSYMWYYVMYFNPLYITSKAWENSGNKGPTFLIL